MQAANTSQPKQPNHPAITLVAIGIFLLGAALVPWLADRQQAALADAAPILPPVLIHSTAPSLRLVDLHGSPASLVDFRGRVVLVNNWATWCPPCRAEMPALQSFFLAHSSDGFVVVAIEAGDPRNQVADSIRQLGLTFPVWLDPQSEALDAFHNPNLPSSYLIDREGVLRMAWMGAVDLPTLEKYVTPLLEE